MCQLVCLTQRAAESVAMRDVLSGTATLGVAYN
jgi:hypothetical protein